VTHWKARGIDLSKLLHLPKTDSWKQHFNSEFQTHNLADIFDQDLIRAAGPALDSGQPVRIERSVRNVNRSVGAMLSGQVAKRYGHAGLPANTIHAVLKGTVGQSFGAFLAHGVTLDLTGDANDYVGKGLSGGRLIVRQPAEARRVAGENIIVGNTVLYGAITGEAYFNGVAGERFAVRNSGAVAVVEGAGDHACEYMTGGLVAILGPVGRNFAAGMSGGIAYVYDPDGKLAAQCNNAAVDLEPLRNVPGTGQRPEAPALKDGDFGNGNPLSWDMDRLHGLLLRHVEATGSTQARHILDQWPEAASKFVKVTPTEYRKALRLYGAPDETQAVAAA
jgi:glutamate synthase (NADPH/NADH) large chain